jgi:hypothetical protein
MESVPIKVRDELIEQIVHPPRVHVGPVGIEGILSGPWGEDSARPLAQELMS